MTMLVSGILEKDGKKIAYISFEEEGRSAEAVIPDCKVTINRGFSDDECVQLEAYLKDNLAMLKRQAAGVNPIRAMMNDN